MNLQTVLNSNIGTGLGASLPRLLPQAIGYPLGARVADIMASRRGSSLTCAVTANQSVVRGGVRGGRLSSAELQQCVVRVLRYRARCLFDLFHNLARPDAAERFARLSPLTAAATFIIELSRLGKRGAVMAVPHMGGYELALLALAHRGFRAQVLTLAQPAGGYQRYYRMWAAAGLDVTPVSEASLHRATHHLKRGGVVVVAVDRPAPERTGASRVGPSFFGRSSRLAAGYTRLALTADVPVVPVAVHGHPDGTYLLSMADPIEMQHGVDPRETALRNGEVVLSALEPFVVQALDQWLMFYPVWPDTPGNPPRTSDASGGITPRE